MSAARHGTLLLTGATGFVGQNAYQDLSDAGWHVRCATRDVEHARQRWPEREWVTFDVSDGASVSDALDGCTAALYMVHGMASHEEDYAEAEVRQARAFADAADAAGLERIVYLGGVAAPRDASDHLRSREAVGEALRAGSVPTIELRASMIVGHGSLSWLIVRDLAARLPVMILPSWLKSRTEPVAIDDVVAALVGALELKIEKSEWFDIPGPEVLSGRGILERTADALGVHQALMIQVPFLSPRLSSHWVRFVTRAQWSVAREVVVGLKTNLIAHDDRFWTRIGHTRRIPFVEAARQALDAERTDPPSGVFWPIVERLMQWGVPETGSSISEPSPNANAPTAAADIRAVAYAMLWALAAYFSRSLGLWTAVGAMALLLASSALFFERGTLLGRGPHLRMLLLGGVAGVAMAAVTLGLYGPVTAAVPILEQDVARLYEAFQAPGVAFAVLLMPIVVVCEEIVWRGAVHGALARRMSWLPATLTGTLVYGLAHAPYGSLALVLASLGAGLCWAALRARSDSLAGSLAAHFAWNVVVMVLYRPI